MRLEVETKEMYDTLRELSVSLSIHHNGSCSTCTEKPVSYFNEPTKTYTIKEYLNGCGDFVSTS